MTKPTTKFSRCLERWVCPGSRGGAGVTCVCARMRVGGEEMIRGPVPAPRGAGALGSRVCVCVCARARVRGCGLV